MFSFSQARTHMLDSQIHPSGVVTPEILEAFETTPRELFVPDALANVAYNDDDFPLGHGRFLLEPLVHAKMLEALAPEPHHVVLDIGCASGYSSAILSPLVMTVIALEEDKTLLDHASSLWAKLDYCNTAPFLGPLIEGQGQNAPYDLIIFNGAVSEVPRLILEQLAPGGRMVAIIKKAGETMGNVTLIEASEANDGDHSANKQFSFLTLFSAGTPYLPGFSPKPSFNF